MKTLWALCRSSPRSKGRNVIALVLTTAIHTAVLVKEYIFAVSFLVI